MYTIFDEEEGRYKSVEEPEYAYGCSRDDDIKTVVQPDICVVCDPLKIDDQGVIGAPDLTIEILSPGNSRKELRVKYELYEEAGVKEYWTINPAEENLLVFKLGENGKFAGQIIEHPEQRSHPIN